MRDIKIAAIMLLMAVVAMAHAHGGFEKVRSIKGIKVTVNMAGTTMVTITPDSQPNQRYMAGDLPEELQKDGLHLIVDGDVGAIPPNVRMIGTPFHITCIKVTASEKKKFKLSKRKWVMQ